MKNKKRRMSVVFVVSLLAIGMLGASIGPAGAGTKAQKVIASVRGISHVSARTRTRNYPWVRFITNTGAAAQTSVKAVVHVHCAGGQSKTLRWFVRDGSSSRVVDIRPGQGTCNETFNAWTDNGARIGISVAVKR